MKNIITLYKRKRHYGFIHEKNPWGKMSIQVLGTGLRISDWAPFKYLNCRFYPLAQVSIITMDELEGSHSPVHGEHWQQRQNFKGISDIVAWKEKQNARW